MLVLCIAILSCIPVLSSNIGCIDDFCSYCTSGYLFQSTSCLPICPTGYLQSSNVCSNTSQLNLFNINFFTFTTFAASSIGVFQSPNNTPFSQSNRNSPIPTTSLGFYFVPSSQLISTQNWVLSPEITIILIYLPIQTGILFQVNDGPTPVFTIITSPTEITFSWLLSSSTTSTQAQQSYNHLYAANGWQFFCLTTMQLDQQLVLYSYPTELVTLPGEFRSSSNSLVYYLGNPASSNMAGFQGYLYIMSLDNQYIPRELVKSTPFFPDCYNKYLTGWNTASACGGGCETWPWCVRASSCSACFSDACASCTGFTLAECTACTDTTKTPPECGEIGRNCASGGVFRCTSCQPSFQLIEGLCIYPPYGYNARTLTRPVVDAKFDTFAQYYGGIFGSGSSSSTYSPVNPDSDDPIAVKSRGLYFNGTSLLTPTQEILFNYKITITSWSFADSRYSLIGNNRLQLVTATPCGAFALYNINSFRWFRSGICHYYSNVWNFIQATVGFSAETTTISISRNGVLHNYASFNGYAFYNEYSTFTVAKGLIGFLYRVTIWQTDLVDVSAYYDECGSGLAASCLWTCVFAEYYNPYTQQCQSCEPSCEYGCSTWGTCNQCMHVECSTCTNFNSTCTADSDNLCNSEFTLTSTNKCCTEKCADCFGNTDLNCLACRSGFYLLGDNCVNSCPLGFSVSGSNCVVSTNPFIDLTLNVIQDTVIDSASGIAFETGVDSSFYPSGKQSDPTPVIQRGYYFSPSTYMQSGSFDHSYNYTMVFYIKITGPGNILTKSTFSVDAFGGQIIASISGNSLVSIAFSCTEGWIVLGLQIFKEITQIQTGVIQYKSSLYYGVYISTCMTLFSSSFTPLTIGLASSFTGFLWSFQMYSSIQDISSLSVQVCATSMDINCVWDCNYDQYLQGYTCAPCSSACPAGVCSSELDCSLCITQICSTCDDYNSCTSCISHAEINPNGSVCECTEGHYWDTNYLACRECNNICVRCTGPDTNDCYCGTNAFLVDDLCVCYQGFAMINGNCQACDSSCFTCYGTKSYQCLTCKKYLLEAVCLDVCPIGYLTDSNNNCVPEHCNGIALRYLFDTPGDVFKDEIYGFTTASSSIPIPVYQRGIYFTGNGSYLTLPHSNNDLLVLGINFFLSIWINPISASGPILNKSYNYRTLLSLSIANEYIIIQIQTQDSLYNYTSINSLQTQKWNHVLFSVEYNQSTTLQIYVNTYQTQRMVISDAPILDILNDFAYLGTDTSVLDFLNGFIYSLELYIKSPLVSELSTLNNCDNCFVCNISEICIPNCKINEFYNFSIAQCIECNTHCTNGC